MHTTWDRSTLIRISLFTMPIPLTLSRLLFRSSTEKCKHDSNPKEGVLTFATGQWQQRCGAPALGTTAARLRTPSAPGCWDGLQPMVLPSLAPRRVLNPCNQTLIFLQKLHLQLFSVTATVMEHFKNRPYNFSSVSKLMIHMFNLFQDIYI